jgi:hypothetical protein
MSIEFIRYVHQIFARLCNLYRIKILYVESVSYGTDSVVLPVTMKVPVVA